jgi:putative oxidoreductase
LTVTKDIHLNTILGHFTSSLRPFFWEEIMTSEITGKVRFILTWTLRVFLGLAFLGIGIEKLTGTQGTIPFFAAIGWGQWFRYFTGALDTAGALLIFVPRWTSFGALIVTCTVGLGTVLCFTMALFNPIFPLVMTLLAATLVGLAWRPKPA